MRLLLMENDGMIAEPILEAMRRVGYAIDWAVDEHEAELSPNNGAYDLVLLDLDSPKQGGIDTLNSYRKAGGMAPVIILTARDAMGDHIRCLDSGTEDYLFSTFDLDELIAKVRALTRRRTGQKQPVYAHGELTLDPTAHEAMKNGVLTKPTSQTFARSRPIGEARITRATASGRVRNGRPRDGRIGRGRGELPDEIRCRFGRQ